MSQIFRLEEYLIDDIFQKTVTVGYHIIFLVHTNFERFPNNNWYKN